MIEKWKGLVIRVTDVGDFDRMLTVLVWEIGKIPVFCRGVKRYTNANMHATELFCYSEFVLYRGKGRTYQLREATPLESFPSLRADLNRLALATYLLDVANEICLEGNNEQAMLRLTLNALWCIEKNEKNPALIKGTYEMRAAAIAGFLPRLDCCAGCGAQDGAQRVYLQVMDGCLLCESCREAMLAQPQDPEQAHLFLLLSPDVLAAVQYVLTAPQQRQFAFWLDTTELATFADVCETYLLSHVGHGFYSLSFYKSLLRM